MGVHIRVKGVHIWVKGVHIIWVKASQVGAGQEQPQSGAQLAQTLSCGQGYP